MQSCINHPRFHRGSGRVMPTGSGEGGGQITILLQTQVYILHKAQRWLSSDRDVLELLSLASGGLHATFSI